MSAIVVIGELAATRYPSSIVSRFWLKVTVAARAGVELLTVKSTSPAFMPSSTSEMRW